MTTVIDITSIIMLEEPGTNKIVDLHKFLKEYDGILNDEKRKGVLSIAYTPEWINHCPAVKSSGLAYIRNAGQSMKWKLIKWNWPFTNDGEYAVEFEDHEQAMLAVLKFGCEVLYSDAR